MIRKKIIELLFILDNTKIPYFVKEFEKYEFMSAKDLAKIQNDKLQDILNYSYKNVPYYNELFNKINIIKNGRVNINQFSKIPPLTKDIIRQQGNKMYSRHKSTIKHYENTSGGSTGEPIKIIQDFDYRDKSWANKILYCHMIGKELGEKEIKLWGSERDIFQGTESFRARVQNWIYNRKLLNSFKMTEKQMESYIQEINNFKPASIWSYIDSIYELARYIDKNDMEVYSPNAILVTAGTVDAKVKKYIERIFKAPVYNQYGSREVGDMAVECPSQKGLHVFNYLYKFEILDNNLSEVGKDEIGEIYVTPLMNYVMPLIRYKIGDTASWSKKRSCPCGRNTPLINTVHGRVTNHFLKKDGTVVHGEYFTHLFYFRNWVKKFKVIQKNYSLIECLVVPADKPDKKEVADIVSKIKLVMGSSCKVKFTFVKDIPITKSGKYLYTQREFIQ